MKKEGEQTPTILSFKFEMDHYIGWMEINNLQDCPGYGEGNNIFKIDYNTDLTAIQNFQVNKIK